MAGGLCGGNGDIAVGARMTVPSDSMRLAARWALNGGLSGAGAAAVLMWVDRSGAVAWQNPTFFIAPGLVFGLVMGASLQKRAGGPVWRPAVFAAASLLAWPVAWLAIIGPLLPSGADLPAMTGYALIGGIGGCVWAAILMAGAQAFRFARGLKCWLRILFAGGMAGAASMTPLEFIGAWGFGAIFIALWGVTYAAMGAVIASCIPRTEIEE